MTITSLDPDVPDQLDPWSKYAVLSLDGSGFRVLSELLILRRLMQRIAYFEREVQLPCAETSADSPLIEQSQIIDEYEKMNADRRQNTRGHPEDESIQSRYLPCHYFDFIVGTSTGGLVALLLGELRMSVDAALDFYLEIMPQLYRLHYGSRLRHVLSVNRRTPQEKLFETIDTLGKNPMSSDESKCKTVVCSFKESDNGQVVPFLFRSYRESESDQARLTVADIAKAGCCHPYSFKPVKFGTYAFYDTGFIFTNPSSVIIDELHQFRPSDRSNNNGLSRTSTSSPVERSEHIDDEESGTRLSLVMSNNSKHSANRKDREQLRDIVEDSQEEFEVGKFETDQRERDSGAPINLLVSLGSGYDSTTKLDKGKSTTARLNRVLQATAEPVHREVDRQSKIDNHLFSYIRLNANLELPKLTIAYFNNSSHRLRNKIEQRTEEFLRHSKIEREVDETASKLVSLRRQRCPTRAWEAFAFGWRYKCAECRKEREAGDVGKEVETFHSAADLVDHFLRHHDSWKVGSEFNRELNVLTRESRTNSNELRDRASGKMFKT